MVTGPRPPYLPDQGDMVRVPLAVKDGLRGIRQRLSEWQSELPDLPLSGRPLSPLALAAHLLTKTRKFTALGEDIARDILLRQRDEGRINSFAGSGFGIEMQRNSEDRRNGFVSSRYAASKIALAHFGFTKHLVLERPIDTAWQTLNAQFSNPKVTDTMELGRYTKIAATTLALIDSGAIVDDVSPGNEPSLPMLVFATLGLAEAVLVRSPVKGHEATLAALGLSADVIDLRKANLAAILSGFDPQTHLAAEYQLLAPPLAES